MPNKQLIAELEELRSLAAALQDKIETLTYQLTESDNVIDIVLAYIAAKPISPRALEQRFRTSDLRKAARIAVQELIRTGEVEVNDQLQLTVVQDEARKAD